MQPITIWRRISQLAAFVITGEWLAIGWLRCPFGVPFVSCPSCPSTDCPGRYLFIPTAILLGLSAVLFGRGFCGWGCPMGLVEDALGRVPKPGRRFKDRWAKVDAVLKWLKWPMLGLVIAAVFIYNYQPEHRAWEYVVRTGSIFNLEAYKLAWAMGGGAYAIRFALLLMALLGGLLVTRFWCRYLCPLGAILSLFNRFSLFGLRRNLDTCVRCDKYPRECIQYTRPGTADCVLCGDCVQGCPAKSIRWGLRKRAESPAKEEQHHDQQAS